MIHLDSFWLWIGLMGGCFSDQCNINRFKSRVKHYVTYITISAAFLNSSSHSHTSSLSRVVCWLTLECCIRWILGKKLKEVIYSVFVCIISSYCDFHFLPRFNTSFIQLGFLNFLSKFLQILVSQSLIFFSFSLLIV